LIVLEDLACRTHEALDGRLDFLIGAPCTAMRRGLIYLMARRNGMSGKFLVLAVAAAAGVVGLAMPAHADIIWGGPQNMSTDTDVSNAGTALDAASFNSSSETVNSVVFAPLTGYPSYSDGADLTVYAGNGTYGDSAFTGGSASYQAIVSQFGFGFFYNNTVTISGLTTGDTYQVQVFDSYKDAVGNTDTIFTGTVPVTLDPSLNQFATGTFVATGPTQSFGYDLATQYDLLNAVSVRDITGVGSAVPEPASIGLLAAGSLMLLRRRRTV
jgi:hypothetical protein